MKLSIKNHKAITTIGPVSNDIATLKQLFENGSSVARLNFSHGTHDVHLNNIQSIRKISKDENIPISIMLDTRGPEIRTHDFKDGHTLIKKGSLIKVFWNKEVLGDCNHFSVNYENIYKDIQVGKLLLIDDGFLKLEIKEINTDDCYILTEALNNHVVANKRGVNIPGARLSMPFLSQKDQEDILFGVENGVDYVAASFVRNAKDVLDIKKIIHSNTKKNILVISKIECQQALDNIDEIVHVSDGIMVARGDLGVEIAYEDVPMWEKHLIYKCNTEHKVVIVATQMLESMITNITPTRAEVTDVYWAAELGCDSTMLSGESAKGDYPIESIQVMSKILKNIERDRYKRSFGRHFRRFMETNCEYHSIIKDIHNFCHSNENSAILVATNKKALVDEISLSHPTAPIFLFTCEEDIYTRYGAFYGVYAIKVSKLSDVDNQLITKSLEAIGVNIENYNIFDIKK